MFTSVKLCRPETIAILPLMPCLNSLRNSVKKHVIPKEQYYSAISKNDLKQYFYAQYFMFGVDVEKEDEALIQRLWRRRK